ncbi:MAG: hypothetical protein ACEQSA_04205 [Weeksellaceae bacterium]
MAETDLVDPRMLNQFSQRRNMDGGPSTTQLETAALSEYRNEIAKFRNPLSQVTDEVARNVYEQERTFDIKQGATAKNAQRVRDFGKEDIAVMPGEDMSKVMRTQQEKSQVVESLKKEIFKEMTKFFKALKDKIINSENFTHVVRVIMAALSNLALNEESASYFQLIVQGLLTDSDNYLQVSDDPSNPSKLQQDMQLIADNDEAFQAIMSIFKQNQNLLPFKLDVLQQYKKDNNEKREDNANGYDFERARKQKFIEIIENDIVTANRTNQEDFINTATTARGFVESMYNYADFVKFYDRLARTEYEAVSGAFDSLSEDKKKEKAFYKYFLSKRDSREWDEAEFNTALQKELEQQAGEKASKKLYDSVLYVSYTLFDTVLSSNSDPSTEFDQEAQNAGDPYTNPALLYRDLATQLKQLRATAIKTPERPHFDMFTYVTVNEDTLAGDDKESFDYTTGRIHQPYAAQPQLGKVKSSTAFINALLNTVSGDINTVKFGYNMRFFIATGQLNEGQSPWQARADIAKKSKANAESLDRLMAYDHDMIANSVNLLVKLTQQHHADQGHVNFIQLNKNLFNNKGFIISAVREMIDTKFAKEPKWKRIRALHGAVAVFHSEFFHELMSTFNDPPRDYKGQIMGADQTLNPYYQAERWAYESPNNPFHMAMAAYAPRTKEMEWDYDHTKTRDRNRKFAEAFEKYGFSAGFEEEGFYDFKNKQVELSFIKNPNINRFKMGGSLTRGGWNRFEAVLPFVENYFTGDLRGRHPEIKMDKDNALVEIWKIMENSGVSDIQMMIDYKISTSLKVSGESLSINDESRYKELIEFMGRKYFSTDLGKAVLPSLNDSDGKYNYLRDNPNGDTLWRYFLQKKDEIIETERKTHNNFRKDAKSQERLETAINAGLQNLFNDISYKAMSVIIAQRMPSSIITRSKIGVEQNGVTFQQELMDRLMNPSRGDRDFPAFSSKEWQNARADLFFVELELREKVTKDAQAKQKEWSIHRAGDNVFGDLNRDSSEVNNGKGYVLDEDFMLQTLLKKYFGGNKTEHELMTQYESLVQQYEDTAHLISTNPEKDSPEDNYLKIRRALDFYRELNKTLLSKPMDSMNDLRIKSEDPAKYNRLRDFYTNRLNWLSQGYQKGHYVYGFIDDQAHLGTRQLADLDIIARNAGATAVTQEAIIKFLDYNESGGFWKAAEQIAFKGQDGWETFRTNLIALKDTMEIEMGPDNHEVHLVLKDMISQSIYLFAKDRAYRGLTGELRRLITSAKESGSNAEEYWTKWVEGGSMDASEMKAFLRFLGEAQVVPPEMLEEIEKQFNATWFDIGGEIGPKYAFLLMMFIVVTLAKEAYEDIDEGS